MLERFLRSNYFLPFILVLISIIPLYDLFSTGLPITHDGRDHVARIANFYLNLTQGNLIPRWAPNLNWGYGHPILMFLYPFPSYVASLFHFLGFSLVDSVKLVFGVSFILSGLSMFLFVRSMFNPAAGFVAGLLYMFAPYRFVDLYVRGAIGEHVAFIFPPLVCYFLYRVVKQESRWNVVLGSLSLAGLILSHNAISLMFLPVITVFTLYLLWRYKKRRTILFQSMLILFFGLLLSAFFWLPAFVEGKYTLRDIVTNTEYKSRFETLGRFFYSTWSYGGTGIFSVQVGFVQWILVVIQPVLLFFLYKRKKELFWFTFSLWILFWFTLFLMTEKANFVYEVFTTLQKFQFPWRFLTLTVFFTALMGGVLIFVLPKKYQKGIVILLSAGLLLANSSYWHANGYLTHPESYYTSVYDGTTDTGESAPIWSVRFMLERPDAASEVIEGDAHIRQTRDLATVHEYEILATEDSRIRENTLYFPGWNVFVNGEKTAIEFQDPSNRGLITYTLPQGRHTIAVVFTDTRLRQFANILTLIGISGILTYLFLYQREVLWKRFR